MKSEDLKTYTSTQLELVYRTPYPQQNIPRGIWKGRMLARIDSKGGRNVLHQIWQGVLFDLLPYGLWFDGKSSGAWYFFTEGLRLGEFKIVNGKSRFRDTECLQMTYEKARLPSLVKNLLYDELKWISADLILGLGAMNFEKGEGDQFFFLLEKVNEPEKV
ncbi:MAG: hypothetical protein KDK41_07945 [Leptospiraceae bacterium]|nr:hypothetical protein [Leptospiraceae bacterium]MCB1200564.1 hypothetical protein [Leptospiraceae bacterium]